MKRLSLREMQLKELEILKVYDKFCNKNNLRYSLCGGTLIGAVRHKGFIPWDDDIDVFMPRPDFEKFISMFADNKYIAENYEVASYKLDNLNLPYVKIFDLKTEIDAEYVGDKYEKHLWIDIFPIEGLDSIEINKKIYSKDKFLSSILMYKKMTRRLTREQTNSCFKYIMKRCIHYLAKPISRKHLAKKIDQNAQKINYDDSKYVGEVIGGYGTREMFNKPDNFDEKLEFEGCYFNVINNYDENLKNVFGDYMQLPKVEDRKTHSVTIYEID